jgi:hypothetical protein
VTPARNGPSRGAVGDSRGHGLSPVWKGHRKKLTMAKAKTQSAEAPKSMKVTAEVIGQVQQKLIQTFQKLLEGAVKVTLQAGSYNGSETEPGYGHVALELALPPVLIEKMKSQAMAVLASEGLGINNVKILNRVTFEVASQVGGRNANKGEIDWNTWAGHIPTEDDDYDFQMLEKSWLGQSFIWRMNELGDYWYTIIGLAPSSNKQVLLTCNDRMNPGDTYVYRLTAQETGELVKQMAIRKIAPDMQARKPEGAVIARAAGLKKPAPAKSPAPKVAAPKPPKAAEISKPAESVMVPAAS